MVMSEVEESCAEVRRKSDVATKNCDTANLMYENRSCSSPGDRSEKNVPDSVVLEVKVESEDLVADILDFSDLDIAGPINHMKLPDPSESDLDIGCDIMENILCVPEDDLAEVDWLMFPDIYGIQDGNLCNQTNCQVTAKGDDCSSWGAQEPGFLSSPVPSRARSKRTRGMRRVWSCDVLTETAEMSPRRKLPKLLPGSSCGSFDSQGSPLGSLSISDSGLSSYEALTGSAESRFEPHKKIKTSGKFGSPRTSQCADAGVLRKCSHCSSTKTPQWRAGPNGPKTLCNACGVRFKSGRLCPEYRPASSPEFVGEVHSNSHRKILEMRRQNGIDGGTWNGNRELGQKSVKHADPKSSIRFKKAGAQKVEKMNAMSLESRTAFDIIAVAKTTGRGNTTTKANTPAKVEDSRDWFNQQSDHCSTQQEAPATLHEMQLMSSTIVAAPSFSFSMGIVETTA